MRASTLSERYLEQWTSEISSTQATFQKRDITPSDSPQGYQHISPGRKVQLGSSEGLCKGSVGLGVLGSTELMGRSGSAAG